MAPRARYHHVDCQAILDAAGRLRDVLCIEAREMAIRGPIYAAKEQAIDAIDGLALAGDRWHFVGKPPRV